MSDETRNKKLTRVGAERMALLYRNARQMKKIVETKYSNLRFDEAILQNKDIGSDCSSLTVCER